MGTHTFKLELSSGTGLQHLLKMRDMWLGPAWLLHALRLSRLVTRGQRKGYGARLSVGSWVPLSLHSLNELPFQMGATQTCSSPKAALTRL